MTRSSFQLVLPLVVLLANGVATGQPASSMPDLATIVERLERAQIDNRGRLIPYSVTRDYQLLAGEQRKLNSQVVAEISFLPPETKTYAIRSRSGGARGEKIVRQILERETLLARDSKPPISRQDYEFSLVGAEALDGQRCYLLAIQAKRQDKSLIEGRIWVDGESYRIRRFEGKLAKNPSWWVKDVRIVFTYGEVAGMWLQKTVEATAMVRLAGKHSLIARDVEYRTSAQLATRSPRSWTSRPSTTRQMPRPMRPYPTTAIGTGVVAPR
ncbi:MAG TPA: hypothetical protein VGQ71_04440 [Terriglobales bacterium]|nr:hypothetical protein [Terriglobales bacterium]